MDSIFDEFGAHGNESDKAMHGSVARENLSQSAPPSTSHSGHEEQTTLAGLDQMQAPVHGNIPSADTQTTQELQHLCFDVARRMTNLVQMPECVVSAQQINEPSGFGFHLFLPNGMTNELQKLTLVHLFYCFFNYESPPEFSFEELMRVIGISQMQEFWSIDMQLMKLRQHPSIANGSPTIEHQLVVLFEEFDLLVAQLRHRTHDHLSTLWNLEGAHG